MGEPISDEVLLGRCKGDLDTANIDLVLAAAATANITSGDCRNSPGPFITLEGELSVGGINTKLIFRNNERGTHTHDEFVEVDVVLLPAGETIKFEKAPPRGGAGGNPLIYFVFLDADGEPLTGEIFLGRCSDF